MLNVVVLQGRLAADPQLRQTTTGKNVASFRIGCDRGRKDANGQSQADWFDIVAWDRTAEFVCRYFQKGSMAVVSGRLQIRDWTDREGGKHRSAEVVVDNIYFGESKRREGGERSNDFRPAQNSFESVSPSMGASAFSELSDDDGELPF